jgi:hypothetical protein
MQLVQSTLFAVRCLTASLHFLGALALFGVAVWLVWRVGHFGVLFYIIGAPFAWAGVVHVRRGCEELAQNEPAKPAADNFPRAVAMRRTEGDGSPASKQNRAR